MENPTEHGGRNAFAGLAAEMPEDQQPVPLNEENQEPEVQTGPPSQVKTAAESSETRPWKMLCTGFSGTGKSDLLATIADFCRFEGYEEEEILICIIDLDDGLVPLFIQERCSPELQERVLTWTCKNFEDWLAAYAYFKDLLLEHKKKTGKFGYLCVDNMGKMWEWAQYKYTLDSYGMEMTELLTLRRKQAIKDGKRLLPTFDPMADYGVINLLHNKPLEEMKILSNHGFHMIWTAPIKSFGDTAQIRGQWENEFRVDYVLRKYVEGEGTSMKFFCDLTKWRGQEKGFTHLSDPTFARVIKAIRTIREQESKIREARKGGLMKKIPPPPQTEPETAQEAIQTAEIGPAPEIEETSLEENAEPEMMTAVIHSGAPLEVDIQEVPEEEAKQKPEIKEDESKSGGLKW